MGFFTPEYWSGLPFPPPGNFPDPEIEPVSPALQVDSLAIGEASFKLPFFFFSVLFTYFLYIIVLVLPYIDWNPPWVYMCSPS